MSITHSGTLGTNALLNGRRVHCAVQPYASLKHRKPLGKI